MDLFDPGHARKVLAEFGRAFGRLPASPAEPAPDEERFLDQAVAGLAQDGKVISARLALFAEMVKGKPWTPATLRQVGGAEGVGVTFLEETFSAATAPPTHRLHQKAARAVLKALLPEPGADLKGHMQSHQELQNAAGYVGRPKEFADLLDILDTELRLVTPTDPEGAWETGREADKETRRQGDKEKESTAVSLSPCLPVSLSGFYQLTHDYLVPALREWLTRKERETRQGRMELLLAERAPLERQTGSSPAARLVGVVEHSPVDAVPEPNARPAAHAAGRHPAALAPGGRPGPGRGLVRLGPGGSVPGAGESRPPRPDTGVGGHQKR